MNIILSLYNDYYEHYILCIIDLWGGNHYMICMDSHIYFVCMYVVFAGIIVVNKIETIELLDIIIIITLLNFIKEATRNLLSME